MLKKISQDWSDKFLLNTRTRARYVITDQKRNIFMCKHFFLSAMASQLYYVVIKFYDFPFGEIIEKFWEKVLLHLLEI